MWTVTVLIRTAGATKENVVCDVQFTANGGPYDGASLKKQFVYPHPASVDEIVIHLTSYANMLKVSFEAPGALKDMEWEV